MYIIIVILDFVWFWNDKGSILVESILVVIEFCVEIVCMKSEYIVFLDELRDVSF